MAFFAAALPALIAGGTKLLGDKINSNRGAYDNPASDTRTTEFQQMLEKMMASTTNEEERASLQQLLSQSDKVTQEQSTIRGNEQVNSSENTTQNQVNNTNTSAVGKEAGSQTSTTVRGDAATSDALTKLLQGGNNIDTSGAMDAAIQRVLRSGAPSIANASNNAGSFDSTVSAQLQNDLVTKAAESAAMIDVNQQNANQQVLLEAIKAGQAGTESSDLASIMDKINSSTEAGNATLTGSKNTGTSSISEQTQDTYGNESQTTNQSQQTNESLKGSSTTDQTTSSNSSNDAYTDISSDKGIAKPVPGSGLSQILAGADISSIGGGNLTGGQDPTDFEKIMGSIVGSGSGVTGAEVSLYPKGKGSPMIISDLQDAQELYDPAIQQGLTGTTGTRPAGMNANEDFAKVMGGPVPFQRTQYAGAPSAPGAPSVGLPKVNTTIGRGTPAALQGMTSGVGQFMQAPIGAATVGKVGPMDPVTGRPVDTIAPPTIMPIDESLFI